MKILASLRVKQASPSTRPAKAEIEHAAEVVSRHGFDVLRKGRRALTVRAEQADIERLLGSVLHAGCFNIDEAHAGGEMAEAVDMLEMTNAPKELEQ